MDMRNTKKVGQAAEEVRQARGRLRTAEAVADRRRDELYDTINAFRQVDGSLAELGRILGVSRSAAQSYAKRASQWAEESRGTEEAGTDG